eukprot:5131231-Pyramimonas_sp.AAC.1
MGHELSGSKPIRKQSATRLCKLRSRMPKVMLVRKNVAPQVAGLRRTGLLSAAARGASVSGVPELELARLRRAAW